MPTRATGSDKNNSCAVHFPFTLYGLLYACFRPEIRRQAEVRRLQALGQVSQSSVILEPCDSRIWNKVKCTLVQALRICTGRTAHRGSRGIALSFHDHGTRRGWGVSVTPRPLFTPGKDPVPIVQEAGWAPLAGLDRCGKSRLRRDSISGPSSP